MPPSARRLRAAGLTADEMAKLHLRHLSAAERMPIMKCYIALNSRNLPGALEFPRRIKQRRRQWNIVFSLSQSRRRCPGVGGNPGATVQFAAFCAVSVIGLCHESDNPAFGFLRRGYN